MKWTQHGETNWRITVGPVEISIGSGGEPMPFIFHVWILGASVGKGSAPTLDLAKAEAWDRARRHAASILSACDGVTIAPLHPVDFYQAAMLLNCRIDINGEYHTFVVKRADDEREYRVVWDPCAPQLSEKFAADTDVAQWVKDLP